MDKKRTGSNEPKGRRANAAPGATACYEKAVACRQRGQPERALEWLADALEADPGLIAAHELGAIIHLERGEPQRAIECYRALLAHGPDQPEAHYNLGALLLGSGATAEALPSLERAVALRPRFPDALSTLGRAYLACSRASEAEALYRRLIDLQATAAEPANNLGVALVHQGRHAEAEQSFRRAVALKPEHPDALNNLGLVLKKRGAADQAIALYRRAIEVAPGFADAMNNLGVALTERGALEEAIPLLRGAAEANPKNPEPLNNLGNALIEAGRLEEAIAALTSALALRPLYPEALNNLAIALRLSGALDDAMARLRQALDQRPGYPEAYLNLGLCWRERGDVDEAIACYDKALLARPDLVEAHWNRALAKLVKGELLEGFSAYEWRFKRAKGDRPRPVSQPPWTLATPTGQTVLIHAEQGLGDTIQFARYVPLVVKRGFKVVLEVQPALTRLFGGVPGVVTVARSDRLPAFDCHVPLLSLPALFETRMETIPAGGAYLRAAASQVRHWHGRLAAPNGGLKVGLVWRGNPKHGNDRNRSVDPASLKPLFAVPGLTLFSLQKELREGDLETLRQFGAIEDLSPHLEDFAETAAAITALDLVIAVDTSVAHLAGALGRPVWVLVPFSPDWRWLLQRNDSPWYRSARLFRQPRPRDWPGAIDQIVGAIGTARLSSRDAPNPGSE